ncbi:NtaA/DmoA family FMN-dependent monooxygenase [Leifsonia poae]|uniref:NtaA/DmoA family FMN-dependent monooxygenase n=1 Tax=Leifsonia poae TaxID=110933 RepID=UPI001CBDF066|nr:NtaA/DmoA family FMN-dependent monooxygenase [Leifsonia poae]
MTTHLILGAMFRAVGAYPSGWRYPGAHRNPLDDAAVLRRTARAAEAAKLDYIFFGDWLATGHDLEFRDPYLLARIDPISAITHLSGVTERIGLIATANTTYFDLYTLARLTASVDRLSGGRAGLNLVTGAEPRAAGNHGRDAHAPNDQRYDQATEFITALTGLWDSWEDEAFVLDQAAGQFIDPERLHRTDAVGPHVHVTGPLNVARPIQGHLPIVHAGTSPRSRRLAAEAADLALVAAPGLEAAVQVRSGLRDAAVTAGRSADDLKVVTPVLPVVAPTRAEAQAIFDELLRLVPVADGSLLAQSESFPPNRSLGALGEAVGLPLDGYAVDDTVPAAVAGRFTEAGQRLVELVESRAGRRIDGERPVTFRHLIATHAIPAAAVVGSPREVADHLESWFTAGAVDGFNVLTPFLHEQFDAFTRGVVPELQRRGLFRTEYEGGTLREHLGLPLPENTHLALETVP